ncbi:transketolase [Desulfobotulus alkaliphilus]|uniref:Transketolase n=1 Tax=Desulfobotulus alkaliphilus TaxID=622671 RepID=A0A562RCC6_9BACT|nr:transketolase [Desulfobotulus alkaliphilus]TWI66056.1 transketolase [Desulfobotulus alkaliphilus]
MSSTPSTDALCVTTIRTLAMDAIEKANSGHPGAPMGLAPAAYALWTRVMNHNPKNPAWLDRDRFVLSGGHGSMLLYGLLHLSGYGVSLEDLKNFRQLGSKTPGHPEFGHTPGVETTTGPLGQGIANAVGMAMAERHLAARFNRPGFDLVNHFTYVMCGDGDLMEGVACEAMSLAGHQKLGRLICIYDANDISIEGSTEIAFTENVAGRMEAMGWHTLTVTDGNDLDAITKALETAKTITDKPSLIVLKTRIAFGSPNKEGSADAHGAPLGAEEVRLTKKAYGWPEDADFHVPQEVYAHFADLQAKMQKKEDAWLELFRRYAAAHRDMANLWLDAMSGFLVDGWDKEIPYFTPGEKIATRAASGKVLNAIAAKVPALMGGSADLAPSNKTFLNGEAEFQAESPEGRNIRFGVREHAMGAIMAGMFLHNGIRPYGATFLVFADYMRPAIRVASLMRLPLIYVFTHDSIAVGEDGPTHQPVEHLASLRAIPNLTVFRPADANETAVGWKVAMRSNSSPTALILSRQGLPVLHTDNKRGRPERGAYILEDADGTPDIVLIASGSEVHLAVEARRILLERGIQARVVSMPSWELFEKDTDEYRKRILPSALKKRLVIEAGIAMGWHKYAGDEGDIISIETFGASGPDKEVLRHFGFFVENVVNRAVILARK